MTGVLAFLIAPDFENPSDLNRDNNYEVVVQVSDGTLTDTQAITVAVTSAASKPARLATMRSGASESGVVRPTDADRPVPESMNRAEWISRVER